MPKVSVWILAAAVLILPMAWAQSPERVIHSFSGSDGYSPMAKLVLDSAGNLYGTTELGGANNWGTVFRLSPNQNGGWTETVLYSFCQNFDGSKCVDGSEPQSGLILDSLGNLYGVTPSGGNQSCPEQTAGCGTVFELSPPTSSGEPWTYGVIYNFCSNQNNCGDGAQPFSDLILDSAGNLYGTTWLGGAYGYGTVFELSQSQSGWTESLLYSFCSLGKYPVCPDGWGPKQGVIFDNLGNLYGTTSRGGSSNTNGEGVVYKLSHEGLTWSESVVRAFPGGGIFPTGELLATVQLYHGHLYSTNFLGGTAEAGGVFQVNLQGKGNEIVTFNGSDGGGPTAGVLIDEKTGTIYGTTSGENSSTYGTVFQITSGQLTVLYYFNFDGVSGVEPFGALISDGRGHLYGTTLGGGKDGKGTIFEITP
jgi:uncharacterized repeat protein (TIGR03803 family)